MSYVEYPYQHYADGSILAYEVYHTRDYDRETCDAPDAPWAVESVGKVVLTRYILPNVIPSVVIIFSVNVADAILTEAGLSFIGLGLPPDTPDWGIDLARGQDYLRRAWWLITFPGLMVALVTLGWSMLGESLSEILNPRLAKS